MRTVLESCSWIQMTPVGRAGRHGARIVALVPVIDMLDHAPGHRISWTTGAEGDQDFQLVTHSGVAAVPCPLPHLPASCAHTTCVHPHIRTIMGNAEPD